MLNVAATKQVATSTTASAPALGPAVGCLKLVPKCPPAVAKLIVQ